MCSRSCERRCSSIPSFRAELLPAQFEIHLLHALSAERQLLLQSINLKNNAPVAVISSPSNTDPSPLKGGSSATPPPSSPNQGRSRPSSAQRSQHRAHHLLDISLCCTPDSCVIATPDTARPALTLPAVWLASTFFEIQSSSSLF